MFNYFFCIFYFGKTFIIKNTCYKIKSQSYASYVELFKSFSIKIKSNLDNKGGVNPVF